MVAVRRSQAQRATAMRPTTHMRAHKRAARMTTKSDSTATDSGGSAAEGRDMGNLGGKGEKSGSL